MLAGVCVVLAAAGCATSKTLTTREEIEHPRSSRPIVVYARGDSVYRLNQYALADSSIHGTGTLTVQRQETPFDGDIAFSDIVAVKTSSVSVMKTLAILGVTALFVTAIVDVADGHHGVEGSAGTTYHGPSGGGGSGTSCPFLYAWDGTRYVLEAEPFGVAWGRALEMTTWHLLPATADEGGTIRLRLSNERQETHYIDSIDLYRIELGSATAAALDAGGRAWPVSRPVAPLAAQDRSGRDIEPLLGAADGRLWECDAASLTPDSGFEDVIEMSFARPGRTAEGTLILTGINTTFSAFMYDRMRRWMGDQSPVLAHAVETDPGMIARLREYLGDASLAVSVWDGHAWVSEGAFLPEANAVPFTRAMRIRLPGGAQDPVRIRLRSMADVWRLDALAMEWGAAPPLPMTRVPFKSATGPAGEDARDDLAAKDGRYAVLLSSDRIDLEFAAPGSTARDRVAWAASARGYLMEWDAPESGEVAASSVASIPPGQRLAMLEELLAHRDLALAPAYEAWRATRAH